MVKKNTVQKLLDEFPNEFAIELFMEKLAFLREVQIGLEQAERGEVVSHEEAKKRLGKWLK